MSKRTAESQSSITSGRAEQYVGWSLDCYRARIRPLLQNRSADPALAKTWLSTCDPSDGESAEGRLFPGCLMILWAEALGGEAGADGIEPVAAALECLHNASLLHDDILDEHATRGRQATLLAAHGASAALLGGDGLFAAAMGLVSQVDDVRARGCLLRLARATEDMVLGQWMDEPLAWGKIASDDMESHWFRMCDRKLALGNVAGSIGAFWAGQTGVESKVDELMRSHSIISQVINDFGDVHGWTGYHCLVPALRPRNQETSRKPTLPRIWARDGCDATDPSLLARGHDLLDQRKLATSDQFDRLGLWSPAREILRDFLLRPQLPSTV